MKRLTFFAILSLLPLQTFAGDASTTSSGAALSNAPAESAESGTHIVIHPLAQKRDQIDTDTGSSTYVFNRQAISNLPQGDNTPLNDVLLQAPGVAQDSYGQLHVRGDHADLQYRIDGIILPEGITGFGQTLDTHFIDKAELLTGALPAEYGYRTAGVVDITTKTGAIENGGYSSIMGGSNATLEANQSFYGSMDGGLARYYFTGGYLQSERGIEPPTDGYHPLHDDTTQDKEFGYVSYAFNPDNKFSFIFGNATNRFDIPANPGQPQQFNYNGITYPSSALDERQYEHNTYAIAALQGNINPDLKYQFAYFTQDSSVQFKPDAVGDLIYNGIAAQTYEESFTNGLQNDFSYSPNAEHTIRAGWTYSYEQATNNSSSQVFSGFYDAASDSVVQTGTTPFSIIDDNYKVAQLYGIYLQDEWHPIDKLTVNYGARADYYNAYVSEGAISPRIGFIYDATDSTRLHTGYARYFTPPPTELIAPVTAQQFANTTGALPTTASSPVRPEQDNYFDVGVTQKVAPGFNVGLDAYYKQAHDLLDEGQFGQALIYAPFNYAEGWVKGIELTADYTHGPFSAYSNTALSRAMGKDVISGQYNFSQAELDYIQSNAVHLDHDQLVSGSAGVAYTFNAVKYSADLIYGSGLRSGFANTDHLPFYTQVDLGAAHTFDLGPNAGLLDAKLTIINALDNAYEIRDGSGIGVFAPQYGPRFGAFITLGKAF